MTPSRPDAGCLGLTRYDGSPDAQAAIEHAGELMPGAVLTVWEQFLDVMARTGAGLGLAPGIVEFEDIDRAYEQGAIARAADGAARAKRVGLDALPRTCAAQTTVAKAILSQADQLDARLIVLGTRGLTSLKSLLLGSVSHAVLQHADRPVMIVRSAKTAQPRTPAYARLS